MPSILRRIGQPKKEVRRPEGPRKFIDLNDLKMAPTDQQDIKSMVKVAEVYRYDDVYMIRDLVNDGNFVIADLSMIVKDDTLFNNVVGELGRIGKEFGGDAGKLGKSLVIVTPKGVGIEKQKIRRSAL